VKQKNTAAGVDTCNCDSVGKNKKNNKFLNFFKKRLDERKKVCYIITCVQREAYTLV